MTRAERRSGPRELQQLAADRTDRQRRTSTPSMSICPAQLPAASTTPFAGKRSAIGLDAQIAAGATIRRTRPCSMNCAPWRRAAASERAGQVGGGHVAVRRDQQSADDRLGQAAAPRARAPAASSSSRVHALARRQRRRERFESSQAVGIEGDVERAGAPVADGAPPLSAATPRDERVEEIEAAGGEIEQRAAFARLDVRREHAGRRLRRAHAGRTIVDDLHRRAAPRQLVGHRAADDAGADDNDVARRRHVSGHLTSPADGLSRDPVRSRFTRS